MCFLAVGSVDLGADSHGQHMPCVVPRCSCREQFEPGVHENLKVPVLGGPNSSHGLASRRDDEQGAWKFVVADRPADGEVGLIRR